MMKKRYFENKRTITRAKDSLRVDLSGRLSPYDELVKKYARQYGQDWRLITAQMYQESKFDPQATSWVGARGLMQIMPVTGRELGFTDLHNPEENIHAGVKYLSQLANRFDPQIPIEERMRFALAAYNVGYGHVLDARRLAREKGVESRQVVWPRGNRRCGCRPNRRTTNGRAMASVAAASPCITWATFRIGTMPMSGC